MFFLDEKSSFIKEESLLRQGSIK